jgi:hypothetical protein
MRWRQLEGLIAGSAVSAAIAGIGALTMTRLLESDLLAFGSLGLMGTPVGALLGWRFAPRVGRWPVAGVIGWMAVSAVLLGDVMVTGSMLVEALLGGGGDLGLVFAAVLILAYGLGYAVLVLPVTLVAAAAWYATMRLLIAAGRRMHSSPRMDPSARSRRRGTARRRRSTMCGSEAPNDARSVVRRRPGPNGARGARLLSVERGPEAL